MAAKCAPPKDMLKVSGPHWLRRFDLEDCVHQWDAHRQCWHLGSHWVSPGEMSRDGFAYIGLASHPAVTEALRALLKECADDLAAHIEHEYKDSWGYPSMVRKKERDMDVVVRVRAALI